MMNRNTAQKGGNGEVYRVFPMATNIGLGWKEADRGSSLVPRGSAQGGRLKSERGRIALGDGEEGERDILTAGAKMKG